MARGRRRRTNGLGNADYERLAAQSLNTFLKLDRRLQAIVLVLVLIAGAVAAVVYYRSQQHQRALETMPAPAADARANVLLGNPSGATADPANRDNYLMLKPYFAVAYNDSTGTSNWVSWRLTRWDVGEAPRKQTFDADDDLPPGFYRVTHKDYSNSGFDRGHLCPHGDRAANQAMSFATFLLTNNIPQAPNVNQKAWANLEDYCRDLVRQDGNRLYITAGPIGRGGVGEKGPANTIACGRVTVPAECWKIIVVVPETGGPSEGDLASINAGTRVIAVVMPNDDGAVGEAWDTYRTSVADVERRTGFRFFDRVAPAVADALRQKVDRVAIPAPKPREYPEKPRPSRQEPA
jgi:endonuclease G, mitochondrial